MGISPDVNLFIIVIIIIYYLFIIVENLKKCDDILQYTQLK